VSRARRGIHPGIFPYHTYMSEIRGFFSSPAGGFFGAPQVPLANLLAQQQPWYCAPGTLGGLAGQHLGGLLQDLLARFRNPPSAPPIGQLTPERHERGMMAAMSFGPGSLAHVQSVRR
jgi:hypothetical protein